MRGSRSNQARSLATRQSLLEATLEVIFRDGYHETSTVEIARVAGASRGALLHHFPTKQDLIVESMEFMLANTSADIRRTALKVRETEASLDQFLDFLWGMFSGRFLYVSMELLNHARTNAEFKQRLVPLLARFNAELDEIWGLFRQGGRLDSLKAEVLLNMTLCILRGMGVQRIIRDDEQYFSTLRTTWKAMLELALAGAFDAAAAGDPASEAAAARASGRTRDLP